HPAALNNLGEMYHHAGELTRALATFDAAVASKHDFQLVRYNRAICHLSLNNLAAGWADLAASKENWLPIIDKRKDLPWLKVSLWQGEDLQNKKILVWGDQGIGDEVLFASMVPDLIARGAAVTIECMDRLAPLFARAFPDATAIARQAPPTLPVDFDFQAPALWLGAILRPSFESFPQR